jgi:hypothetical protein
MNDENLPPPFPYSAWDKKKGEPKSTAVDVKQLFKLLDAVPCGAP